MAFEIDPSIHWTDHFVNYGFAVLRNQLDSEFIASALGRIRENVEGPGSNLPFDDWTVNNVKYAGGGAGDEVLDQIYEQPNIRHIIDTMFGTSKVGAPTGWDGVKSYQVFLTPFDPGYEPKPFHGGHIDFGGHLIPKFGNAFVMQIALHDTEPFGGNITVIPGSHKLVQKRVLDNPYTQYPYDFEDFEFAEPYEFVARAGDVFLMHHMTFHSGHKCGGATHKPRIALHMQIPRTTHLTLADPYDATNPPWVRSFTLNGRHHDPDDTQRYLDFGESKKRMWGEWTSEDGECYFKIYTWSDNALRARIRLGDVPEQISRDARFDGRQLSFGCVCESPGQRSTLTECRAVLEVNAGDSETMTAILNPVSMAKSPTAIKLRKTGLITTRLGGPE